MLSPNRLPPRLQSSVLKHDDAPDPQQEVRWRLGRCLFRLQQCETLIRHLVVNHRLSGPAWALERIHAQRIEDHATKPLGFQIDVLLQSFFTTGAAAQPTTDHAARWVESPAFDYRSTLRLSADDYARTRAGFKRFVDLRNDLVHDFAGRFDCRTTGGCAAACEYLEGCYTCIEAQYQQLCGWAGAMASVFTQAPGCAERLRERAAPVGMVQWAQAGIVRALREAMAELNASACGWTRLDHAIALILEKAPTQTPDRYGCKSWRHVLNASRVFDLQYRMDENDKRVAWFRARQG